MQQRGNKSWFMKRMNCNRRYVIFLWLLHITSLWFYTSKVRIVCHLSVGQQLSSVCLYVTWLVFLYNFLTDICFIEVSFISLKHVVSKQIKIKRKLLLLKMYAQVIVLLVKEWQNVQEWTFRHVLSSCSDKMWQKCRQCIKFDTFCHLSDKGDKMCCSDKTCCNSSYITSWHFVHSGSHVTSSFYILLVVIYVALSWIYFSLKLEIWQMAGLGWVLLFLFPLKFLLFVCNNNNSGVLEHPFSNEP